MKTIAQLFAQSVTLPVNQNGDNCWVWSGFDNGTLGYGKIRLIGGKTVYAHRVSYELFVGPIAEGLVIDHLCRNPGCVNPEHLEAVTQKENVRRTSLYVRLTHCKKGHRLDLDSYRWRASAGDGERRECRICKLAYNRERGKSERAKHQRCISRATRRVRLGQRIYPLTVTRLAEIGVSLDQLAKLAGKRPVVGWAVSRRCAP